MNHSDSYHKLSDYFWLLVIMLVGLAPRALLLVATDFDIDSDEAIVGLMAKHILEGHTWPVFYYGQDYMGSLEATLAAGSFALLGISNAALKLVPLYFSVVFIGFVYLTARRFTDRYGARVAALLTALGPSTLILWSIKARGGFIEILVIGSLALTIGIDLLLQKNPKRGGFVLLGLVLGLGWWVNNQIVFYLASLALVFFGHILWHQGIKRTISLAISTILAFLVGSAPFWYANLVSTPRFSTLNTLFGGSVQAVRGDTTTKPYFLEMWADHLVGFFEKSLPMIFGARRFWSEHDVFPLASWVAWTLYGFVFLFITLHWLLGPGGLFRKRDPELARPPFGLLLLFCLMVGLIFTASSFGWLSEAPRYLLPLYSVLFVLVGVTASEIRASNFENSKRTALVVVGLFLSLNLSSNYLGGIAKAGQPFVYEGERVSHDHRELYRWLEANNYRHILTNYWIGYRVAFETKERVTFSRYRGPQSLRIPEYEMRSSWEDEYSVYVLVPKEAEITARGLAEWGYTFRRTALSGYVVLDHIEPIHVLREQLELRADQVKVLTQPDRVSGMLDGDLGTRWGSGAPQSTEMRVDVAFDVPTDVDGLSLELGFWRHDGPRGLRVLGQLVNGEWCVLFETDGTDVFADVKNRWLMYFISQPLLALRLEQTGQDKVFDWSIAELRVYGSASFQAISSIAGELEQNSEVKPESLDAEAVGVEKELDQQEQVQETEEQATEPEK